MIQFIIASSKEKINHEKLLLFIAIYSLRISTYTQYNLAIIGLSSISGYDTTDCSAYI